MIAAMLSVLIQGIIEFNGIEHIWNIARNGSRIEFLKYEFCRSFSGFQVILMNLSYEVLTFAVSASMIATPCTPKFLEEYLSFSVYTQLTKLKFNGSCLPSKLEILIKNL